MKKAPHVIWVSPNSKSFYRTKGEVRCRPGSVIPRLSDQGIKLNVLVPYEPTLLPKTKLSAGRVSHHTVKLSQDYPIEIIKLTRGAIEPGIYMAKMPPAEPALFGALFAKAALALATQLKKPVDIFHIFDWETSLLPLYLELDKSGKRIFDETRTFLNVHSLRDQGNFSPAILNYLGIPKGLFHSEGIEFYGKISYLKSGLLFSDGVGIIENGISHRAGLHRNGTGGMDGLLDHMMHKMRRWASERSLRSHLEAYNELLSVPKPNPLLPLLLHKINENGSSPDSFVEVWGPQTPERYQVNTISFIVQSPTKAYALWEWSRHEFSDYGIMIENRSKNSRRLLSRGLQAVSDFWLDVQPDQDYVVELVGWDSAGKMHSLLRSRVLRTPRLSPSSNRDGIFIDMSNRRKFRVTADSDWEALLRGYRAGGSSAFEWALAELPSSHSGEVVK